MEATLARNKLSDRLDNYYREEDDIIRRLGNGVPPGKKGKLQYRLQDLQARLIPETRQMLTSTD